MNFPANIMHIYPGGAIGLNSDAELLQTARNTVAVLSEMEHARKKVNDGSKAQIWPRGAWNATNLGCLFFVAAVRVGFDPETILNELHDKIDKSGLPNGFLDKNPHGIENLSTVPNTIQEMMLLSHEGILRFFRVWPTKTHPDARFFGLYAYGGFRVDASLKAGEVEYVHITSTVGGSLTFENPWRGNALVNGHVFSERIVSMDTKEGEVLYISKE